ncbi:MAG: hypothetical protein CVU09_14510 [Bacteroidetes bacterium HGW-Bacteroidetes-4]|jgi:hypothetical protein|nr:MAG: hypothetical protein CVU09_14510 [Bacteroidetes bacterium HGW-Bacteroidetes-4]
MKRTDIKFKTGWLFVFVLLFREAFALSMVADSLSNSDSLPNPSYLTLDVSYTNNNIVNNNLAGANIAALFADVTFYHKSGFYAGFMPTNYFNAAELSYDLDWSLGYSKFFNSGFYVDANYLNHSYRGDSALMGIDYRHAVSLSLNYSRQNWYLFTDATTTFGASQNYMFDAGLGYYASFDALFTKNDNLTLFPMLSLGFGSDYWLFDGLTLTEQAQIKILFRNEGFAWNTFDWHTTNLILPITYYLGNISASFTYLYAMPTSKYKALSWQNQSAFMFSLGYMLNF